ncbi:hypothetical protein AB3R30_25205 [Leptolyngbyaceae cyanobacterium UHCC 1019]
MQTIQELRAELIRLEGVATEIRSQGDAIVAPDFWLDSTGNGKTSKTYYRKRWFDGDGDKHSEALTKGAYDDLNAAIKLGRQLQKNQQDINKVVAKIDRIMATAAWLGLPLA